MERVKSILASILLAVIVFAGFGFGVIAIGFAIVLGGAFALALRLAAPRILAEAEKRAYADPVGPFKAQPASL
ncbi:hypothetical protein [Sulfitobacter sp. BSw21498]|jgi:hypothetical protein|uniref:hypothetical protein n=1 Tax=Sulfitobacter sp. BSw21498 TaxID=664426 RepID=UPI001110AA5A|nr:hypothetical protein [Sulfitobacter sp. BSw21498]